MHALTDVIVTMFSWPAGIVVGNLIASLIWAAPALLHLHRKLNRHHAELKGSHEEMKNWHCHGCRCGGEG